MDSDDVRVARERFAVSLQRRRPRVYRVVGKAIYGQRAATRSRVRGVRVLDFSQLPSSIPSSDLGPFVWVTGGDCQVVESAVGW